MLSFRRSFSKKCLSVITGLSFSFAAVADYSKHPLAAGFVDEMVQQHGFTAADINHWLSKAQQRQPILDSIARPAEESKTWKEYRPIFIVPMRITNGVLFWNEHRAALERAPRYAQECERNPT